MLPAIYFQVGPKTPIRDREGVGEEQGEGEREKIEMEQMWQSVKN